MDSLDSIEEFNSCKLLVYLKVFFRLIPLANFHILASHQVLLHM